MAHAMEHLRLIRVVIREDFSRSRCELLIRDIIAAMANLEHWDDKEAEHHR
jgi:glutamate decarboxylase